MAFLAARGEEGVRGADDLAMPHAAAGEQGARNTRPVIASRILVDGGGASKFAPDHDRYVLFQAAIAQVLEQSGEPLVEEWQILAQRIEIIAVMIPAAEGHGDATRARFHEAPRGEEMAHQFRAAVITILRVALAVTFDGARVFFAHVEGIEELARSQHAKGLLIEGVQAAHHSAGVHVAAEFVEAGQERPAVGEAFEGHAVERHVFGGAAFIRFKGRVGHAEKAGLAGARPFHVPHFGSEADEGRHGRIDGTLQLADDGAHRGPPAGRLVFEEAAGEALEGVVPVVAIRHGADQRAAIHHLGEARQMLGDLETRNIGGDGLEFAADLGRRIHLQIEDILMRRAARQEDHDHRLVRRTAHARRGLSAKDLRQTEAAEHETADLEEITPREAVTESSLGGAVNGQHGFLKKTGPKVVC